MAEKRYQDYVIKDGKFVGDFEGMYKDCKNPWLQSDDDNVFDSRRAIAKTWIKKISLKSNVRVCEIGCGFGHITAGLQMMVFVVLALIFPQQQLKKQRL